MLIRNLRTGFPIGDPEIDPFPDPAVIPQLGLQAAFDEFILSASGWRKIFAAGGDPESSSAETCPEDIILAGAAAKVYTDFVIGVTGNPHPRIAVAVDSRPTGPSLADAMIRALASGGVQVEYLFIAAAPEIMAYVAVEESLHGFVYISASHNPLGYNGLKFGLGDGGVLDGDRAKQLIQAFTELQKKPASLQEMVKTAATIDPAAIYAVFEGVDRAKNSALEAYRNFSNRVVTYLDEPQGALSLLDRIRQGIRACNHGNGIGIVAELNGSARGVSIDVDYLSSFGLKIRAIHTRPREIVHGIVPEGVNLRPCADELERVHAQDTAFGFGYVPDNDGDRGNIVYYDRHSGKAKVLDAQEVFALACVAELSYLKYLEGIGLLPVSACRKQAVVVNGPTSLRIDYIARAFGAAVYRTEVGEANVVCLARELRRGGYTVRILGEGSNGGNITHPAAVRDPINTIMALIKLTTLRRRGDTPGLFEIWLQASGREVAPASGEYGLAEIIATLPPFVTTAAFEERARVEIETRDQGLLKRCYESIFPEEWEQRKKELKERFGIFTWREINYEEKIEKHGVGSAYRSGRERGGFKILFKNEQGNGMAFIWMRGSGTEPVFRVLADTAGADPAAEEWLLAWHKDMIRRADHLAREQERSRT